MVEDVREGTDAIREKKSEYLPKFEAETQKEWDTRVRLTFASDAYAMTLDEHVGLIAAPKLGDDTPDEISENAEDIDGEGNHLEVFAHDVADAAMHWGHAVLWTDYPSIEQFPNLDAKRKAGVRAYTILYGAPDVLDWAFTTYAGSTFLTRIKFREVESDGTVVYREYAQEVVKDERTGKVLSVGGIAWEEYTESSEDGAKVPRTGGALKGPDRIPARIIYGGRRKGRMHSSPHLHNLAVTSIELTQVKSDYALVMHKCNVPTPVFVNRKKDKGGSNKVRMGQGIDLDANGNAFYLEPSGVALNATRDRMGDLKHTMQRQGATTSDGSGKVLTATEAQIVAKSRNAKLRRASRSMKDGYEGALADQAAFQGIKGGGGAGGGSVEMDDQFAGTTIDPAYLAVLLESYREDAIPLDAYMFALAHGKLPDDFAELDTALRLLAEAQAEEDAAAEEDEEYEDGDDDGGA